VNTSNYRPVAVATEAKKNHMHRKKNREYSEKKQKKNTIDINIIQMMVGKQRVKSRYMYK